MFRTPLRSRRAAAAVTLTAAFAGLALATPASAATKTTSVFFEETAEAFWAVPHTCADGAVVEGTLLVRSTRDYESPDTADPAPTARVQYLAVCPDGTSFSWIAPAATATITSTRNLRSVTATGSGIARDNIGATHQVSFDVTWTGVGRLEKTVRKTSNQQVRNTSTTKQRAATATGRVTFDGSVLVDGAANHPTRPAPFIRTDEERTTQKK
jgi:hypothetical protein